MIFKFFLKKYSSKDDMIFKSYSSNFKMSYNYLK